MGAKSASKPRLRSIAYKCDLCGRKFTKLEALKSHQRTVHNHLPKKLKPKPLEVKSKAKPEKKEKSVKKPTKLCPSPQISSNVKKDETKSSKQQVVEFECPKCFRTFVTYFPALKHIQKFHCVNRQGGKVPPNSPYLIQPIRIELCLKCNRKVKSIPAHICDSMLKNIKESLSYTCTGCQETFTSLRTFDIHVSSFHTDDVESLFFPNNVEFTKWKSDMETQTKAKYAIVDKYDSKCFYHCSSECTQLNDTLNLCPSTLIIQEFSKGIQVHLYKLHFKHNFVAYRLTNKYKKYLVNSFLKDRDCLTNMNDLKFDENTYKHFKTLMESIITDAAKTDLYTLKILLGKALDMTSILANYDEKEQSEDAKVKSMNDSQIVNALMDKGKIGKRKSSDPYMQPVKRSRSSQILNSPEDTSSPKIINCYSLANNESTLNEMNIVVNNGNSAKDDKCDVKTDDSDATEVKDNINNISNDDNIKNSSVEESKTDDCNNVSNNSTVENPELIPIEKKVPQKFDTFSSYDQSYADFLSKNFNTPANGNTPKNKLTSTDKNIQKKNKSQKKPVMKTKIGQFKGVSPKKHMLSPQPKPTSKRASLGSKDKSDLKLEVRKPVRHSYEKPKGILKHEVIPVLKKPIRFSSEKPKVELKYEVKEQEDDCNILILKL